MAIVETRRQTKTVTLVDNVALTVPSTGTVTVNSDYIKWDDFDSVILFVTLGEETATATFDAKFQYKDSNGNYYDIASGGITQMTAAGSQQLLISKLYGNGGRIVYVYGDAEGDAFAGVTLEAVFKS